MTMVDLMMMDRTVTQLSLDVGSHAIRAVEAYRNHDKAAFDKAMRSYDDARLAAECAKRDIFDAVVYEAAMASFGEDDDA